MRWQTIALFALTLAGFALRLHYLTTTHPFFDEYTTVLAARQILQQGWPVLPSGLFYEHGLLATYLIAPFTALFINIPLAEWSPAHWGLMLARWPSVWVGTVTIPLLYFVGRYDARRSTFPPARRQRLDAAALLAAGLFALSPEGMVWGGRARMYALATLLALLAVYWAYRGAVYQAPARYRWGAGLALLTALLSQFGSLMVVPPLVVAMLVAGWFSCPAKRGRSIMWKLRGCTPWFLRSTVILEGLALAAIVGLAVFVKRLGRPVGLAPLSEPASTGLPAELIKTVSYQTTVYFTWPDAVKFLSRQFGVPHHFWLAVATVVGALAGLVLWLAYRRQGDAPPGFSTASGQRGVATSFSLFLWVVFGLIILQMITLLEPFRRNPRYIVMYLPLFYLIAARAIFSFFSLIYTSSISSRFTFTSVQRPLPASRFTPPALIALLALFVFTALGYGDLRVALSTPEPAYEAAFKYILEHRQSGDFMITMNTPAAGLYLGQADGFAVQADADQFLIDQWTVPVDRWLGVPWVGTAASFNAILNANERVWFVIDAIRLPVYYRGDWQAVLNSQMEPVWSEDEALIYLTRSDRVPLPDRPEVLVNAALGDSGSGRVELVGYVLQQPAPGSAIEDGALHSDDIKLVLFWQPLSLLQTDYTVFLHLRDSSGGAVAQYDGQPLDGAYPTTHWRPGETVIDPITLSAPPDLPAGAYTLWAGLYRLDTLTRLPVVDDASGEDAVRLGEITLP